jgi:phosphoenolpyruvate carboxylase
MKLIDKLGRKLAKDFNKSFSFLDEEQLKVMQETKMFRLFANKSKYGRHYKPRSSSSTDMDHVKILEIFANIANKKVEDETVKELLDSQESSNILVAAAILNNKYK